MKRTNWRRKLKGKAMEFDLNTFLFGAIVGGTVIAIVATRYTALLQNQRIEAERRFRKMNWQACHWATLYREALADNQRLTRVKGADVEWPEELEVNR